MRSSGRAGYPGKRSDKGAGGRSGLRARRRMPSVRAVFRALDFGNDNDSPLLLADNYNHTTNDPTTETRERTEDAQRLF